MGIHADTCNKVRKETATKIFGQPMANEITQIEKELIAIAAAIPTSLGGGNYGHTGMIVDQAKYLLMTGTPFNNPQNPGVYPANIARNAANGVRACKEALHKEVIREYEIYCGVDQTLKDIILKAVDNNYLLEIEDKILLSKSNTKTNDHALMQQGRTTQLHRHKETVIPMGLQMGCQRSPPSVL